MTTNAQHLLTPRSYAHHYGQTRYADHFIYRCYDGEDRLLYIGCTANVARRIAAHQHAGPTSPKASQWLAACMVRFETEGPFSGRDAGRAAERQAIQSEQPLFNYQERANADHAAWMTRSPIGAYLIEKGHVDLALATACTCWRETREANGVDPWCRPHLHELETWLAERGAA